jgi:hypothetical protein
MKKHEYNTLLRMFRLDTEVVNVVGWVVFKVQVI